MREYTGVEVPKKWLKLLSQALDQYDHANVRYAQLGRAFAHQVHGGSVFPNCDCGRLLRCWGKEQGNVDNLLAIFDQIRLVVLRVLRSEEASQFGNKNVDRFAVAGGGDRSWGIRKRGKFSAKLKHLHRTRQRCNS